MLPIQGLVASWHLEAQQTFGYPAVGNGKLCLFVGHVVYQLHDSQSQNTLIQIQLLSLINCMSLERLLMLP